MTTRIEFAVVIENLDTIAATYSDGVAGRVLHEVRRRVDASLDAKMCSCSEEPWGLSLRFDAGLSRDLYIDEAEAAVHLASLAPIEIGDLRVVAALAFSERRKAPGAGKSPCVLDIAQCRVDMEAAVRAYTALARRTLRFAEQPIIAPADPCRVLYRECLARLSDDDGSTIMPDAYLPAIERLGLAGAFDRSIVRETMMQLHRRPEVVLGCNVSALSICDEDCWRSILRDLFRFPDIARRLVIEVTETAAPPDVTQALELIETFRKTGCRIALDDFGSGWNSISFARAAHPDIIKIDATYVSDVGRSCSGRDLLSNLIAMSSCLASQVVVEGVEDEHRMSVARMAGAHWVQGYFVGQPVVAADTQALSLQARFAEIADTSDRHRYRDQNTDRARRP